MPTSNSNVFCRVNRRRPCRICGKPDWRSYVRRDVERISICMRVSDGARKINRIGGAIFIHDDRRSEKGIDVRVSVDIPHSPIAPIAIRDFVYGRLDCGEAIQRAHSRDYAKGREESVCSRHWGIGAPA